MTFLTRHRHMPVLPTLFQSPFWDDDDFGRFLATRDVTPAVNVFEDDADYEFDVAAPGLDKDDFKVSLDDGQLIVTGEKKAETEEKGEHFLRQEFSFRSFTRRFDLPENIKKDKIRARYEDGILRIRVGKGKPVTRAKPKEISVK